MSLADAAHVVAAVTPAVEFGGRLAQTNATLWPYLTLGVTAASAGSLNSTASLAGQPIALKTPLPELVGHASIGLDAAGGGGMDIRAQFAVDVGANNTGETGLLRLAWRF